MTVQDTIELLKELGLCSELSDPAVPVSERDAVTSKEAFMLLVVPDIDQPLSDETIFCPSPTPAPTPLPMETPGLPEVPEGNEESAQQPGLEAKGSVNTATGANSSSGET